MMNKTRFLGTLVLTLAAAACGRAEPDFDFAAYEAEIMDWRAGRLERLLAPTGFLTQVGLFWLDEGRHSVGSAEGSAIRLPATAAPAVGEIFVSGNAVSMTVTDGVTVTHEGQPVSSIDLPADTSGRLVLLEHGSIAWSVIERGGKLAVRVRDYEHPWVKSFGPLPYYDVAPQWRLQATLRPYDKPREIVVNTVIEGFQQYPVAPGVVEFEVEGRQYELEPTLSGDSLFFVFGDATNRGETYGAGRYLYADMPGEDGSLTLDFNRSYSPPCAFNDFSTCPVASPRNRLPFRVEAGEKYDPALFYDPKADR